VERRKLLMLTTVAAAAALIVWQVGFQTAGSSEVSDSNAPNVSVADGNSPDQASTGNERPGPQRAGKSPERRTHVTQPSRQAETTAAETLDLSWLDDAVDPNKPADPNEPLEAVNLQNVEMKAIIGRIAEWTGKTIIPDDEAMKQKITIYAPKALPRARALEKIYGALRMKGYIAEDSGDTIYIKPVGSARLGLVPTILPDQPLATIENKEQIVQRFFKLTHYSPGQMAQIVQPLIGEDSHLSADESAGTLLIIDSVATLMRIEAIIAQFDVAQTAETVTEIFEIRHRDPEGLVTLLRVLLDKGAAAKPTVGTKMSRPSSVASSRSKGKPGRPTSTGSPTSVVVGTGSRKMTLLAEPRYNWIIARATIDDIKEIRQWIEKLDKAVPTVMSEDSLADIENKNQIVQRFITLENYSPSQMANIIRPLMGESGYVTADEGAGNLLLIDTVENLLRIEGIIARFDVAEAEDTVVHIFEIRNREPEEIVQLLETLFGGSSGKSPTRHPSYSKSSSRYKPSAKGGAISVVVGVSGKSMVLIPESRHKWVIAKASAEDIKQIEEWILKLDTSVPTVVAGTPLTGIENKNQVVQRFVELRSCSPTKMAQIIGPLMGESGYISAEESAGNLLLIDTVENLLRIEAIIAHFDVDEAEDTEVRVFEIRHREPEEIIKLLETLFGDSPANSASNRSWSSKSNYSRSSSSKYRPPSRSGGATSVIVGAGGRTMALIPEPRQKWIIAKASAEDLKQIEQWIAKFDTPVPTIMAGEPLSNVENRNQVVQRFVELRSYSPGRMAEIIGPLMGESGYVSADESAGNLLLVDTVENLLRIEAIIARFDTDEAGDTIVQIFELRHREPDEVIELLETLLSDKSAYGSSSRGWSPKSSHSRSSSSSKYRPPSRAGGVTSVIVGSDGIPVSLIGEPRQKWIIARAPAEDIRQIGQWIERFDTPVPTVMAGDSLASVENRNQVVQRFIELKNYSPGKMAEIVAPMMSESGYVSGDETTGSLLVVDTVENLLRIEEVIARFDVAESEHTVTQVFEIDHREPDEVLGLLETLLGDSSDPRGSSRSSSSRNSRYSSSSRSYSSSRSKTSGASLAIVGSSGKTVTLVSDPGQKLIIAKASPEDLEEIDRWIRRLDRVVPTLISEESLADIENKNQIVQKCIKLESFSPSRMADIILPLMSESGYISADETTGNLLLIDTVESLMRIEAVVAQFDVPEAEDTVTEILEVANSDPYEIVQLVRMLLSDGNSRPGSAYGRSSSRYGSSSSSRRSYGNSNLYRGNSGFTGANSVLLGPSETPVVLIPEPKRGWIIARASAEDMKTIREWVAKLDLQEPLEKEYESVPITYANVQEVASHLNQALQQMPGTELETSVLVQALDQARQIVIFGRKDLREMVKKLIEEIDVPPGQFLTKHFKLEYADPDMIKKNIEDLYGPDRVFSTKRSSSLRPGTVMSTDTVKIISHLSLKEVTVVASPDNMDKIRDQIAEWDVPINVNEVQPRIIELHNSDTVEMVDLLTSLFSRDAAGSRFSAYDYLFGYGHEDKEKIVGPLYGQLTFEEVPGTKKIIVISNIPEAYDVVEDLVRKLDQEEMAEVPRVMRLKYRDPETLAQHLNAMFNEAGTSAAIMLSKRGLRDYSMDDAPDNYNNNNRNANTNNRNTSAAGSDTGTEYRPWWTTGAGRIGGTPISNVIGRARFIPDAYSKSILVLAPPEFMENIEQMINELDTPGKQVMIKVIIVQVDHSNMTSLGMQLSSDSSKWATLDHENAVTARNVLGLLEKHGALVFGAGGDAGSRSEITVGADINVLLDFLVKELDARILNQQTLWTKDNEEAEFFKGQRVGFQTRVSISDTGGRATSDFAYEKVGMILRTRPSITPEMNVDMIINVVLSQLTSEIINSQRVRTEMDTTTNMIVENGQTLMLGGMLFQEDSNTKRKIPLFGDLPLIGGLFRHKEGVLANSELLIFVTPHVVDGTEDTLPETIDEIEQPKTRLRNIQEQLEKTRPAEQ